MRLFDVFPTDYIAEIRFLHLGCFYTDQDPERKEK